MGQKVRIVITGTPETRHVGVEGQIDDLLLVYWMLGEARRICERRADECDTAQKKGGIIVPGIRLHLEEH